MFYIGVTPMKNYPSPAIVLCTALFVFFAAGCKKTEKVHTHTAVILSGTDPGLNTCGWIIRVKKDNTVANPLNSFKPLNLDPQYQTDGMHVNITYTIPDMPAIKCGSNSADLAGYTQIGILSIKLSD